LFSIAYSLKPVTKHLVTIAELEMSNPSTKSMVLSEPEEPFNFDQMYKSDKVVVFGKTHPMGV
jgi:hypothetical protein